MTATNVCFLRSMLWRALPAVALILMVFAAILPAFPATAQTNPTIPTGTRTGQISSSDGLCCSIQPGIPSPTAARNDESGGFGAVSSVNPQSRGKSALEPTLYRCSGPPNQSPL